MKHCMIKGNQNPPLAKQFGKLVVFWDTLICKLKEKVVLLSPDKGNGVVILDIQDYQQSMQHLFADRTKFRVLQEDPTNRRFKSLQEHICKLRERGEISKTDFQMMFPKNAKIDRPTDRPKCTKSLTGFHHYD